MRLSIAMVAVALGASPGLAQDVDRGVELYQARKYEDAEKVLRAAAEKEPENGRVHYYLGLTLLERKKPQEAEEALKKARDVSPGDVNVLVALARSYTVQRRFDQAEETLKQAAELDAGNAGLLLERGKLQLARKRYQDAVQDLEQAIEREPGNAYAHYYAGLAYNGLRRRDKALHHFDLFLRLAPDAPEAPQVRSLLAALR